MPTVKGISFPFRVGSKGGVVMTKADLFEATHIEECLRQLLLTPIGERVIEQIGSRITVSVFEPNEESTHSLLRYEIMEAINNYERRINVNSEDIEIYSEEELIYVRIQYTVKETSLEGIALIELGGQVNE